MNDFDHGPRILTPAEAAHIACAGFEWYRNTLREMARKVGSGEREKPVRAVLVLAVTLFDQLEEDVRAELGAPSRLGSEPPELVDEPVYVPPVVEPISPGNRVVDGSAWRMDARHGVHRSSP